MKKNFIFMCNFPFHERSHVHYEVFSRRPNKRR